jgi:hypothetical protein
MPFDISSFLHEQLLDEVSLKQLKLKYPGWEKLLDYVAGKIENKYVPVVLQYVFTFQTPSESTAAKYEDGEEHTVRAWNMIADSFIEKFKTLDKAIKSGMIDRLADAPDTDFAVNQKMKDVGYWQRQDWSNFSHWIDKLEPHLKAKEQEKVAQKDTDKLVNTPDLMIIVPKSEAASCVYGKGTEWCISATKSKNYFVQYTQQGAVFFFLINKKETDPQYQKIAVAAFAPEGNEKLSFEIYDATDERWEVAHNPNDEIPYDEPDRSLEPLREYYDEPHMELIEKTITDYMIGSSEAKAKAALVALQRDEIAENQDWIFVEPRDLNPDIQKTFGVYGILKTGSRGVRVEHQFPYGMLVLAYHRETKTAHLISAYASFTKLTKMEYRFGVRVHWHQTSGQDSALPPGIKQSWFPEEGAIQTYGAPIINWMKDWLKGALALNISLLGRGEVGGKEVSYMFAPSQFLASYSSIDESLGPRYRGNSDLLAIDDYGNIREQWALSSFNSGGSVSAHASDSRGGPQEQGLTLPPEIVAKLQESYQEKMVQDAKPKKPREWWGLTVPGTVFMLTRLDHGGQYIDIPYRYWAITTSYKFVGKQVMANVLALAETPADAKLLTTDNWFNIAIPLANDLHRDQSDGDPSFNQWNSKIQIVGPSDYPSFVKDYLEKQKKDVERHNAVLQERYNRINRRLNNVRFR